MSRKRKGRKLPSISRVEGNAILREWCAAITGTVLSVGSGDDRDREGKRYRNYFSAAAHYATSDISPGADMVLDVRDLSEVEERYDAVFCHSVLEHVDDIFNAAVQIGSVLAVGGVLLIGVPFRYKIHRAPQDFWRFTEFGVRYLLGTVADLIVEDLVGVGGTEREPAMYWARARKQ